MALKSFLIKLNQDNRGSGRPDKPVISHEAGLDIQKMPLSEFEKTDLILKVYSEVLNEDIYFISDDAVLNRNPLDAVAYTAQELQAMLDMAPEEVKAAHEVKKVFHRAKVVEHKRAINR